MKCYILNNVMWNLSLVWIYRVINNQIILLITLYHLFSRSSSIHHRQSTANPKCVDANECSSNPCGRGARCINQLGGYTCECLPNSEGDPYDRSRGCTSNNITPQGKITNIYSTNKTLHKRLLNVINKKWSNNHVSARLKSNTVLFIFQQMPRKNLNLFVRRVIYRNPLSFIVLTFS